jgi:hypothetical protein
MNLAYSVPPREALTSISGGFLASDSQGQFKIEGLSPGKYGIFIDAQQGSDLRADPLL